ncbi:MAG: UDP-galactopyranose mutase [Alphaproteobacteria bacterium]|nr:UDP-galactopyranose mutase [Alphaproteobacteria bacterium]
MKNIVVVGTGFSGSILARKIAEEMNFKVKVVEKRPQIAGNMYDEYDEHGILIQKYGPHVLVTNEWKVIEYLSQYAKLMKHTVKELSYMDGQYVRLPFNFESVQQLVGAQNSQQLLAKMRKAFAGRDRVPVLELVRHEDKGISDYGKLLFEKSFRTYCAKQWDLPPETLDPSIMNRSAMAMGYDERYMNKDFQYLPEDGFTPMFENMLNHPNITLTLNDDATKHITFDETKKEIFFDEEKVDLLVWTGAIDELFNLKYGELPYRSLDITYEWFDKDKMYPEKIISYPQAKGYTRKTEYKFMMKDYSQIKGTTIATEYPSAYVKGKSIAPFYPVITDETKSNYQKYLKLAQSYGNIFLCGRLAEFRYYNMDDCILHAFDVFEEIKKYMDK